MKTPSWLSLGAALLGCGGPAGLTAPPAHDGPSLEAQELAALPQPSSAAPPTRAQVIAWADAGVGALLASVIAEPVRRGGAFLGFRLRGVDGPQTLAHVGLCDGDVLLRVGEQALVTPDDAHAALEAARTAEALVFEVERAGERVEVSTPIVGAPQVASPSRVGEGAAAPGARPSSR